MIRRLTLALALFLAGCGTIYPLTADPSIPFAEGQVMASARDDGAVDIDLSTAHMGDPGKLSPEAVAYVVWVKPLGAATEPENVGAFKPNPDLKGWLTFRTKHREVELFVTIEPTPDAEKPTGRVVLRGEVTGLEAPRVGAPATAPTEPPPPASATTGSTEPASSAAPPPQP